MADIPVALIVAIAALIGMCCCLAAIVWMQGRRIATLEAQVDRARTTLWEQGQRMDLLDRAQGGLG